MFVGHYAAALAAKAIEPRAPLWTLIGAVVAPVIFFNLLFARHSKSIFVAWDHFFDPHEREGGDGDGNVPRDTPPAPQRPPGRARLPVDAGV